MTSRRYNTDIMWTLSNHRHAKRSLTYPSTLSELFQAVQVWTQLMRSGGNRRNPGILLPCIDRTVPRAAAATYCSRPWCTTQYKTAASLVIASSCLLPCTSTGTTHPHRTHAGELRPARSWSRFRELDRTLNCYVSYLVHPSQAAAVRPHS